LGIHVIFCNNDLTIVLGSIIEFCSDRERVMDKNMSIATRILLALLALTGALIAIGGAKLLSLGGSPYYLIGGLAVLTSAILCWRRNAQGAWLYAAFQGATLGWALWEVGMDGWQLAPRLIGPAIFGLFFFLPSPRRLLGRAAYAAGITALILLTVNLGVALLPNSNAFESNEGGDLSRPIAVLPDDGIPGEWAAFGRTSAGTRFSPLDQITLGTVSSLQPAWTFHTRVAQAGTQSSLEATPIMVGGRLYLCSQTNVVIALDPETGSELWRYDPKAEPTGGSAVRACRGVAYYKAAGAADCPERIITATFNAQLIALDAITGKLCPSFGTGGIVDLKQGMGSVLPGFYYISSAPTIVRGNIVLGGWVADNQSTDEPSGVIRAFNATTGKFVWAWDAGNPANSKGPPPGEYYTRSTPNSWAPMSADESLGTVYVPTGNPTPDHFGGHRTSASEKFGSSVVALDAETGALKWSFQTTHHDLWDYDVPAQPTLIDVTRGGQQIPALVQATKRGELFLLDRRTGTPIATVDEKPAPQNGKAPEERLSPTQPYSTGMPSFAGERLTERAMWGMTPLDQLWCRIRFRELRYDGPLTPPGLTESILYPSIGGGMNWGGVAVDPERGVMIVNSLYYASTAQLVSRQETDQLHAKDKGGMHNWNLPLPMAGTPYGIRLLGMLSPLNVPCNAPPFGKLSAIDLKTNKLLWSRPVGTIRDSGPLGIESHLPIPMGLHNFGGALTTRSGLTFIGSFKERTFRAFNTTTGKEVWSARLPAGAHANPMTYISPKSGRQFVVVAAGGHVNLQSFPLSDTFVAFALPEKK
jgi:membrane-bound PQQ-dependent dehydrogenase (glucose/quinate/shikimate family)